MKIFDFNLYHILFLFYRYLHYICLSYCSKFTLGRTARPWRRLRYGSLLAVLRILLQLLLKGHRFLAAGWAPLWLHASLRVRVLYAAPTQCRTSFLFTRFCLRILIIQMLRTHVIHPFRGVPCRWWSSYLRRSAASTSLLSILEDFFVLSWTLLG